MPRSRPNVVLILADDLGFSDPGCYGGEIRTPNLDGLAKGGLRMAQFYNGARCCPTRASLLTGLYAHQTGVGEMNQRIGDSPAYQGELNDRCATVAEVLKGQGYHTGMVGKWHLVHLAIAGSPDAKDLMNFEKDGPISPTKANWPVNRGFEEHWGTIPGVENYWAPYGMVHNETPIKPFEKEGDFYYTDWLTDRSVGMIDGFAKDRTKPFFMYVAYTAPHWPMMARQADIDHYKGVYDVGWDRIRETRYARQVGMGLIKPEWKLSPRAFNKAMADRDSQVAPWAEATNKPWEASRMEAYAAMVEDLDRGIGRIMAELKAKGVERNTVVFFMSDNGGCQENVQPGWYDIPTKTPDGRPMHVGNDARYTPGADKTVYQSYGPMWANASNTPFRRFKHLTEEGGISAPFIVRYPEGQLRAGSIDKDDVGHIVDIMPTILDLTGSKYPATMKGHPILPLEGKSLVPVFKGGKIERGDLFWEHENNRAMRRGDFKIVAPAGEAWKLFDLAHDRTELNDLSAQKPELKREMIAAWTAWAHRVGAYPRPGMKEETAHVDD